MLPIKFRKQALSTCHDDVGYPGIERSLDLLKDQFNWPVMAPYAEPLYRWVLLKPDFLGA